MLLITKNVIEYMSCFFDLKKLKEQEKDQEKEYEEKLLKSFDVFHCSSFLEKETILKIRNKKTVLFFQIK